MKKKLLLLLACIMLSSGIFLSEASAESIHIWVDADEVRGDVSPFILNGRTMVPVRLIAEYLGAEVEYVAKSRRVEVSTGVVDIILTIDSDLALVAGKTVKLEVPAIIRDSRAFVPLRFIAEALMKEVQYDHKTRTVRILSPDGAVEELPEETAKRILALLGYVIDEWNILQDEDWKRRMDPKVPFMPQGEYYSFKLATNVKKEPLVPKDTLYLSADRQRLYVKSDDRDRLIEIDLQRTKFEKVLPLNLVEWITEKLEPMLVQAGDSVDGLKIVAVGYDAKKKHLLFELHRKDAEGKLKQESEIVLDPEKGTTTQFKNEEGKVFFRQLPASKYERSGSAKE